MEHPAEFDLEHALSEWRAGFTSVAESELDELADHLREEFARLHALGLAADEAWLLAARRLGSPARLDAEYAKVDGRRSIPVFLLGYLAVALCLGVMESMTGVALALALQFGTLALIPVGITCVLIGGGLLSLALPRLTQQLPVALRSPGVVLAVLLPCYALALPLLRFGEGWVLNDEIRRGVAFGDSEAMAWTFARQIADVALLCLVCPLAWFSARRQRPHSASTRC